MAKRVVNKFGEDIQKPSLQMQTTGKPYTATDYLREAIGAGKLSQIFDLIKKMNTSGLSKKEKSIVSDIKNKERRKYLTEIFNDRITPILEKKHKEFTDNEVNGKLGDILNQIEKEFVDVVGDGDKAAVEKIVEKAVGKKRSGTDMSDENETSVRPDLPKSAKTKIELGKRPSTRGMSKRNNETSTDYAKRVAAIRKSAEEWDLANQINAAIN